MNNKKETMQVLIDGKECLVPFYIEEESGGWLIKVPNLCGNFAEVKALGDTVPSFVSLR